MPARTLTFGSLFAGIPPAASISASSGPGSRRRGRWRSTRSAAGCWRSTGRTSGSTTTCGRSRPATRRSGESMSSAEATHARGTATPGASTSADTRIWAVNSSALLTHFVRALWSEKTRTPAAPTLFGPGGVCGMSWSDSATLCSPSASDRVALGLTTDGTGCSCSATVPTPTASLFSCGDVPRLLARRERCRERAGNGFGLTLGQWCAVQLYPTPTASDWKGSTGKGSRRRTLAERAAVEAGEPGRTVYPHPEFVEAVMRFPTSWTALPLLETPSIPSSPNGSADA